MKKIALSNQAKNNARQKVTKICIGKQKNKYFAKD